MGYTTTFGGQFEISPPLETKVYEQIDALSDGPLQEDPSTGCPGGYCQWILYDEGHLEWDGGEKFYDYIEWLKYIINQYLKPNGYKLNGSVQWSGESSSDKGLIKVTNNEVETFEISEIIDNLEDLKTLLLEEIEDGSIIPSERLSKALGID